MIWICSCHGGRRSKLLVHLPYLPNPPGTSDEVPRPFYGGLLSAYGLSEVRAAASQSARIHGRRPCIEVRHSSLALGTDFETAGAKGKGTVLNRPVSPRITGEIAYAISRYRKVTIWPRVQVASGLKVVELVPAVTPLFTAHRTASE